MRNLRVRMESPSMVLVNKKKEQFSEKLSIMFENI